MMLHIDHFISDSMAILKQLDKHGIDAMIQQLLVIRENKGRLFFLGVGGSAANCSHAVNDFRKIAGIEAYTPVDNVSELSARTNDEGWHTVFSEWLKQSHLTKTDGVFVLSVGGGSLEKNISANIVYALQYAKHRQAKIFGIVGREGGYTAKVADTCIIIPPINPQTVTPHVEAFHSIIWHLMVSDPRLMRTKNKWESFEHESTS